jgi:D-threo-aldose 1-dehydrogenase
MKDMSTSGIKALEELKRSGDIRAIGMGLNRAESLDEIPRMVDLDFLIVANAYTLLDQSGLSALDRFAAQDVSVIIATPFASGILATGPGPEARYMYQLADADIQEKTSRIKAICDSHGVPLAAVALRFPLGHPSVVSIIPGSAHPNEMRANLASFAHHVPASLWSDLKSAGLVSKEAPVPD